MARVNIASPAARYHFLKVSSRTMLHKDSKPAGPAAQHHLEGSVQGKIMLPWETAFKSLLVIMLQMIIVLHILICIEINLKSFKIRHV